MNRSARLGLSVTTVVFGIGAGLIAASFVEGDSKSYFLTGIVCVVVASAFMLVLIATNGKEGEE